MATMTTSPMTDGQIERAIEIFRAQLRKHAQKFHSDAVQEVFGQREFAVELVGVLRKRAEAVSNLIVRRVKVDHTKTPKEVLDATGRRQYINADVVKMMPKGEGDEGDVFFFKPDLSGRGGYISDADLEKEFELRGLKPCDPYKLSQVNTDDPTFADKRPNGTHWQDADGNWCYVAFERWYDGRNVCVNRCGHGWDGRWWFAGLRK